MARFGQAFINQLTSPGYAQGMFNLGSAIGSAPAVAAEKQQESQARQIINEAIVSNDPTKIMQASQAVSKTMPEMSTKLAQLAQQRTQTTEQGRLNRGLQGGLAAIQQAARRGIPLEDLQEAQSSVIGLGGTQKQIADAYSAGLGGASEYNYSEETILVDGKPTRVQVAVNKNNPNDRKVYSIGETAPSGKGAELTLGKMLKDAGFEADLSTLEGVKQARRFAITELGNAALAGQLASLEEQMTPFSLQQSFETLRVISPNFGEAEDMLEKTERYRTLNELNDQDVAGLTALLERTITSTTENDLKAVAELARFRSSKDLAQRIKDFTTMTLSGELSDETLQEYSLIMEAVDQLSRRRLLRAVDETIIAGSEKEAEAAKKVRKLYETEDTEARFIK